MDRQQPVIRDAEAKARFASLAESMSLDPESLWVGGYVEYEWAHDRHIFGCSGVAFEGAQVLELGCNVGATAVVLAALGARVTAVDVDLGFVRLAAANCQAHGYEQVVDVRHVADTTQLSFADATFDVAVCNSVLEYVPHDQLAAIQREVARVVKPGGVIFVMGTSNRLWPREVHSGNWFGNYIPRRFDRWLGPERRRQRGVFPWQLRHGFGDCDDLDYADRGAAMIGSRRLMHASRWKLRWLKLVTTMLRPFGATAGAALPNISFTLRKKPPAPGAQAPSRNRR